MKVSSALFLTLVVGAWTLAALAQGTAPAPRDVEFKTSDGTVLKASYFPAAKLDSHAAQLSS